MHYSLAEAGARRLRRAPPHPGRRDHRRPRRHAARPSAECRRARRHRRGLGQCAGGRGRCGAGGRHAAAGLQHGLLDRVPEPELPADRAERRPLRCAQASGARRRRRRAGRPRGAVGGLARVEGAGCLARAGAEGICRLEQDRSISTPARPTRRCPPTATSSAPSTARPRRPTRRHRRRRPAGRADQELAHQVGRHLRLRVRLLLHGLRDRRRLGHQDGASGPRGRRVRRRRLLPHDELRHLQHGADRP